MISGNTRSAGRFVNSETSLVNCSTIGIRASLADWFCRYVGTRPLCRRRRCRRCDCQSPRATRRGPPPLLHQTRGGGLRPKVRFRPRFPRLSRPEPPSHLQCLRPTCAEPRRRPGLRWHHGTSGARRDRPSANAGRGRSPKSCREATGSPSAATPIGWRVRGAATPRHWRQGLPASGQSGCPRSWGLGQ